MQKLVWLGALACVAGCFQSAPEPDFVVAADLYIGLGGTSTGRVDVPPGGRVVATHTSWPGHTDWEVREADAPVPLRTGESLDETIELSPEGGATLDISWSNQVHSGTLQVHVRLEMFDGAEWLGWLPGVPL